MPLKDMNEFCLRNECRDSDSHLQEGGDRKVAGHKLILCLLHNDEEGQITNPKSASMIALRTTCCVSPPANARNCGLRESSIATRMNKRRA
jgi:hypothetical protein